MFVSQYCWSSAVHAIEMTFPHYLEKFNAEPLSLTNMVSRDSRLY